MRGLFFLTISAFLLLSARSDTQAPRGILPTLDIALTAMSVDLVPGHPEQKRLGKLDFLGGWRINGSSREFGGISAMLVERGKILAVSDLGGVIRFDDRMRAAEFSPLPIGCGRRTSKSGQDAEAMARSATDRSVLVVLEGDHVICRFDPDARRTVASTRPAAMRGWEREDGTEAIAQLPDGRLALFGEKQPGTGGTVSPLLLMSGDPASANTTVENARYRPPAGTRPVDAVTLKDGRVLVLNRAFRMPFRWRAVLVEIDSGQFKPGATVEGREIARFAPPVLTDNYEALAVEETHEGSIVWIASDDNFFVLQRTLLMKFRLQP